MWNTWRDKLMQPKLETHEVAWDRVAGYRQATRQRARWSRRWEKDVDCAIRMRGYTELVFGNLDSKVRKKIDSALKRGYGLEKNTQLPHLLRMIEQFNPIQPVPIGYVGKTEFNVYVPTVDEAEDLRKEIIAVNAMTDGFKGNRVKVGGTMHGYHSVLMQWAERKDEDDSAKRWNSASHLKPCFTQIRPCIDSWLDSDAAVREEIARWCAKDDSTIRVPFDSHKRRRKT